MFVKLSRKRRRSLLNNVIESQPSCEAVVLRERAAKRS